MTSVVQSGESAPQHRDAESTRDSDRYKWIALTNTTIGVLMATIDASLVLISLPAIFRGINVNPLTPGNTSYLLWMLMGYMVVTAVLVVSFGRIGDMYGRVKMYNLGFAIFTTDDVRPEPLADHRLRRLTRQPGRPPLLPPLL